MEAIVNWFDDDDLFIVKYGLIISNFITIAVLLIVQRMKKNVPVETPNQNVLLVTAHPDDEAMFFIPTIETLKQQKYNIHLLCLSNGNADNLGKLREDELAKSCKFLGIGTLKIINDPDIQDGMKIKWPKKKLQMIINQYIEENAIKGVITFDNNGVSNHINHIYLYKSMLRIKKQLEKDVVEAKAQKNDQIKIFVLESTNILRKYLSVLDFFISAIYSDQLFIQLNPIYSWKAMRIHYSQFVWYRKLFVILSRYGYINTLKRIY